MTKPANFPGRKNARRSRALARLLAHGTRGKLNAEQVRELADALTLKLNHSARATFTKKARGVGSKRAA